MWISFYNGLSSSPSKVKKKNNIKPHLISLYSLIVLSNFIIFYLTIKKTCIYFEKIMCVLGCLVDKMSLVKESARICE